MPVYRKTHKGFHWSILRVHIFGTYTVLVWINNKTQNPNIGNFSIPIINFITVSVLSIHTVRVCKLCYDSIECSLLYSRPKHISFALLWNVGYKTGRVKFIQCWKIRPFKALLWHVVFSDYFSKWSKIRYKCSRITFSKICLLEAVEYKSPLYVSVCN